MCKGSSASSTIDSRVWDLLNKNVTHAEGVANMPFQAYSGQQVAPLSANEQQATALAPGAFSAGAPALNQAQSSAANLSNFQAPDLLSGIAKYQNPYDTQVVNATLADLGRARDMQRVSDQQHTPMGAFGGSRQGVADSLTNEAYLRTAANTAGNLRQAGFNAAAGLANNEANLGLAGAGVRQTAANTLGSIGNTQNSNFLSALGALGATGQNERGVGQAANDAAYQEFLRQINYPIDMQQVLNSSLGLFGNSANTSSAQAKSNATGSIISGIGTLGSLAFSDARLKDEIETVGYDDQGRRWVSFRYLWDGAKRIGVIAQEVMRSDPHAVVTHPSGYLMVDYGKLGA